MLMEAVSTSETPVNFYKAIRRSTPAHCHLNASTCFLCLDCALKLLYVLLPTQEHVITPQRYKILVLCSS
jgi:hypothetical protein